MRPRRRCRRAGRGRPPGRDGSGGRSHDGVAPGDWPGTGGRGRGCAGGRRLGRARRDPGPRAGSRPRRSSRHGCAHGRRLPGRHPGPRAPGGRVRRGAPRRGRCARRWSECLVIGAGLHPGRWSAVHRPSPGARGRRRVPPRRAHRARFRPQIARHSLAICGEVRRRGPSGCATRLPGFGIRAASLPRTSASHRRRVLHEVAQDAHHLVGNVVRKVRWPVIQIVPGNVVGEARRLRLLALALRIEEGAPLEVREGQVRQRVRFGNDGRLRDLDRRRAFGHAPTAHSHRREVEHEWPDAHAGRRGAWVRDRHAGLVGGRPRCR